MWKLLITWVAAGVGVLASFPLFFIPCALVSRSDRLGLASTVTLVGGAFAWLVLVGLYIAALILRLDSLGDAEDRCRG